MGLSILCMCHVVLLDCCWIWHLWYWYFILHYISIGVLLLLQLCCCYSRVSNLVSHNWCTKSEITCHIFHHVGPLIPITPIVYAFLCCIVLCCLWLSLCLLSMPVYDITVLMFFVVFLYSHDILLRTAIFLPSPV